MPSTATSKSTFKDKKNSIKKVRVLTQKFGNGLINIKKQNSKHLSDKVLFASEIDDGTPSLGNTKLSSILELKETISSYVIHLSSISFILWDDKHKPFSHFSYFNQIFFFWWIQKILISTLWYKKQTSKTHSSHYNLYYKIVISCNSKIIQITNTNSQFRCPKDKLDEFNHSGETLLMQASTMGRIDLVKSLLEQGVNPNIQHSFVFFT